MVKIENHCLRCPDIGHPCIGSYCPNRRVKAHYCDKCDPKCECPLDEVYEVDGKDLCEDCLKEIIESHK
jgi:hypothetical protein